MEIRLQRRHCKTESCVYFKAKAVSCFNYCSSYSVFIRCFPLAEMAGFTPFLLQFLALRPSTCLVSEHPPSSNQLSLSPLPLASSRSSSVVLAFSCQSLQDSEQPSKHYRHPSSVHVHVRDENVFSHKYVVKN